jgi:hypothetical protein
MNKPSVTCDKCKHSFDAVEWDRWQGNRCDNRTCPAPNLCDNCWEPNQLGSGHSECFMGCESQFCNTCTEDFIVKYNFTDRGEPTHDMVCPLCGKGLEFAAS